VYEIYEKRKQRGKERNKKEKGENNKIMNI